MTKNIDFLSLFYFIFAQQKKTVFIMSESKKLFTQFPPVSTEEWMDKINKDLKGIDFDKKLVWKSKEGIDVMPFYRAADLEGLAHMGSLPGKFPFVRGNGKTTNDWLIRQDIIVEDPAEANKKALNILNRGVNSLGFRFNKEAKYSRELFSILLEDIYIESIEINFHPEGSAIELVKAYKEFLVEKGVRLELVSGAVEADPLGRYLLNGKLCIPVEDGIAYLKDLIIAAEDLINLKLVRIAGANFSNAGASVIQELGMTISMANEYMAKLTDIGMDAAQLAKSIAFTFAVGSNYFFEIAKMRAARMLWSSLVSKYGVNDEDALKMDIHATTGEWNLTVYDPYVNMLRTQTEAMSATLGGVDSLTVGAFDLAYNVPSEFSERIARNQQLLLKEESHFDKIVDPAAGSYYIENLTSSVAEKSWDLLIEIEGEGGFLKSLRSGLVQKRVENNAAKRNAYLAKGREKLLGTNIYPNINEVLDKDPVKAEPVDDVPEVRPLKIYRGSEMFEQLRFETESWHSRPRVFLLTTGNPAMRKARAQFASSFFSVAGYEIIDNIGFETAPEGVLAALDAKADIVVICSSDEEYITCAPVVFNKLKGKAVVVIAGIPDTENELRDMGIENFISLKSDTLKTLKGFNKLLGINQL
jgi:methylmalonyl-CoA mutase